MNTKDKHISFRLFLYARKENLSYLEILNCTVYTRVGNEILLFNKFHLKGKREK